MPRRHDNASQPLFKQDLIRRSHALLMKVCDTGARILSSAGATPGTRDARSARGGSKRAMLRERAMMPLL